MSHYFQSCIETGFNMTSIMATITEKNGIRLLGLLPLREVRTKAYLSDHWSVITTQSLHNGFHMIIVIPELVCSDHSNHSNHTFDHKIMETSVNTTQLNWNTPVRNDHLQCSSTVFRPLFQLRQSIDKKNAFTLGWKITQLIKALAYITELCILEVCGGVLKTKTPKIENKEPPFFTYFFGGGTALPRTPGKITWGRGGQFFHVYSTIIGTAQFKSLLSLLFLLSSFFTSGSKWEC